MKKLFLLGLCVGFAIMSSLPLATAQDTLPNKADLTPGEWNAISPGGETICSRGTDYTFFVHPGDESKVMIHFAGGGACWNGVNCSKSPLQTFDENVAEDEMAVYTYGVFDYENDANPVKDYTAVVVSYCTADVHVGDAVVDHDGVEIHHNGVKNAQAVLDWVYANYTDPDNVFVNGCSAGAYGSIFFAPQVAAHYPDATFAHLGDSGIGVTTETFDGLEKWGFFEAVDEYLPALAEVETFDGTLLYQAASEMQPDKLFTEYTTVNDAIQTSFYQLMGGKPGDWSPQAQTILDTLDALPNFAYFTATGDRHCILPLPEFYSVETNGVNLTDWVTALANGEMVETVSAE